MDPKASVAARERRAPRAGLDELLGGEVFGVPLRVDGTLVARRRPLAARGHPAAARDPSRRSRSRRARSLLDGASEPCARLEAALQASTNGRRVGQVGFGTNTGVLAPIDAPARRTRSCARLPSLARPHVPRGHGRELGLRRRDPAADPPRDGHDRRRHRAAVRQVSARKRTCGVIDRVAPWLAVVSVCCAGGGSSRHPD